MPRSAAAVAFGCRGWLDHPAERAIRPSCDAIDDTGFAVLGLQQPADGGDGHLRRRPMVPLMPPFMNCAPWAVPAPIFWLCSALAQS
jgi:hypothetical protein